MFCEIETGNRTGSLLLNVVTVDAGDQLHGLRNNDRRKNISRSSGTLDTTPVAGTPVFH